MSQQESDPLRSVRIIGQYKALVGFTTLLGLLVGILFAALNPPEATTSKALVEFTAPQCPGGGICGGPAFSPGYIMAEYLKEFPGGVQITLVTGNVLSVSAVGETAAQAEATADKAAQIYITYAGSLSYMGQPASARLLQPPGTVTKPTPPKEFLGDGLLGAVFGAMAGIIAALAAGQTIIDPVALPQGPGAGGQYRAAGQQTPYASTAVSLQQMTREDAERKAADVSTLGRSAAWPP